MSRTIAADSPLAKELAELSKDLGVEYDGVLKADALVKAVEKDKGRKYPEVYGWFTWDDTEAARQYRLIQARWLLVRVQVEPFDSGKPIQAYVSLISDRAQPGGGYRDTRVVLADPNMSLELLEQAMEEHMRWQAKYERFKEFKEIFQAAKKVKARIDRKIRKFKQREAESTVGV